VRELFEDLREEELIHQGLLEKQKARYPETMEPDVDPEDVDTPAM
jgi:rubrerythrin